jgi:hypothetical protein
MLCLQDFQGFFLSDTTAPVRLVLQDEIRKWLADDHAYLGGPARAGTGMPTSTFEDDYIRRTFEYQISGMSIRDNLFQILKRDVLVQGNYGSGLFFGEHLAVVAVSQPFLPAGSQAGEDMMYQHADIPVRPAAINISVQTAEIRKSP